MTDIIEGKIISTTLGEFANQKIVYGYIGIELADKTHVKVKVDAYTKHETLTPGDEVVMEVHKLPNTGIIVARRIQLKSNMHTPSDEVPATA